jgi:hypothetical protein
VVVGIFGKYFWGDVGGGHHGGNILELFKEFGLWKPS